MNQATLDEISALFELSAAESLVLNPDGYISDDWAKTQRPVTDDDDFKQTVRVWLEDRTLPLARRREIGEAYIPASAPLYDDSALELAEELLDGMGAYRVGELIEDLRDYAREQMVDALVERIQSLRGEA